MGFWNSVGTLAKNAGSVALKEAKAAHERRQQYEAEMPSMRDRELAKIVIHEGSSSPLKAGVAFKELKNRGYMTMDDVKELL